MQNNQRIEDTQLGMDDEAESGRPLYVAKGVGKNKVPPTPWSALRIGIHTAKKPAPIWVPVSFYNIYN